MTKTYTLHINDYQMIFYAQADLIVMVNNLQLERPGCLKDAYVTCNETRKIRFKAEDYIHDYNLPRPDNA